MASPFKQTNQWCIFTRELEAVLATRGLRIGQLNDLGVVYHPEKVRRLQRSLKAPNHLTTLNPEEMERLGAIVGLTDAEQNRLRASLLATAVEMVLMDRIDAHTALMASNDVFEILLATIKAQPAMVVATGVRGEAMIGDTDAEGDEAFTQALGLIDRATLELHASAEAISPRAQGAFAQEAFEAYGRSLDLLRQSQSPLLESDEWRFWHDEAMHGRERAASLIHPHEEE